MGPARLAVVAVVVCFVLTVALLAFTSFVVKWLDPAMTNAAWVPGPFSQRLESGLGLGRLQGGWVPIVGAATVTGCLGGAVVGVRLLVRLYARRAAISR